MILKKTLVLITLLLIAYGCTPQFPDCIKASEHKLTIRWGNYLGAEKKIIGYVLHADGSIKSIEGNEKIFEIEKGKICEIKSRVQKLFLQSQALNVPADTNRFVEFINPALNVSMRALWNPNHNNVGNEQFQVLFDSLSALIPEKYAGLIR